MQQEISDRPPGDLIEKQYHSIAVWVLETNPAVGSYKNAGAQYLTSRHMKIEGAQLLAPTLAC